RLGVADQKVLILTNGVKPNVFLSGRNLPTVHVMPYSDVSTYHVLWSDVVLIESGALGSSLEPAAEPEAEEETEARPRRSADSGRGARKAASKAGAKKAATRGAAKKAASKKPAAKKTAAKKSASKSSK